MNYKKAGDGKFDTSRMHIRVTFPLEDNHSISLEVLKPRSMWNNDDQKLSAEYGAHVAKAAGCEDFPQTIERIGETGGYCLRFDMPTATLEQKREVRAKLVAAAEEALRTGELAESKFLALENVVKEDVRRVYEERFEGVAHDPVGRLHLLDQLVASSEIRPTEKVDIINGFFNTVINQEAKAK